MVRNKQVTPYRVHLHVMTLSGRLKEEAFVEQVTDCLILMRFVHSLTL